MDPTQLPNFLKDVAAQGAMVFTVTQVIKDQLMRWWGGELDAQATRGIALLLSLLVAAMTFAPIGENWPVWWLNVMGYGAVVIFPAATTGHVIAQKLGHAPAPKP